MRTSRAIPPSIVATLKHKRDLNTLNALYAHLRKEHKMSGLLRGGRVRTSYHCSIARADVRTGIITLGPWVLGLPVRMLLAVLLHEFAHLLFQHDFTVPHEQEHEADCFSVSYGLDRHLFRFLRRLNQEESPTHPSCRARMRRLNKARREFSRLERGPQS